MSSILDGMGMSLRDRKESTFSYTYGCEDKDLCLLIGLLNTYNEEDDVNLLDELQVTNKKIQYH